MRVFKFGGASVNNADAVKNVADIITRFSNEELVLVFSAMGKTTNALEKVTHAAFYNLPELTERIDEVENFHFNIADALFDSDHLQINNELKNIFDSLKQVASKPEYAYDEFYDRIVSFGEILSTTIISRFLNERGIMNVIIPAQEMIITGDRFRDAALDWAMTEKLIKKRVLDVFHDQNCNKIITQGFIGSTIDGKPTTLDREGSDFTASVIAYCLDADEVIVWKDVDGLLNCDPDHFANPLKIDHISYHEVVELTFFGAKILHPKTIKPLQNKSIPLMVKSFFYPKAYGTLVSDQASSDLSIPFLIKKNDQALISFFSKDFSFIAEDKLSKIFWRLNQLNIKINLMQNSAISFSIVVNDPGKKLKSLSNSLANDFDILYNRGLELLTIRNFTDQLIKQYLTDKEILLEQRSRKTIQVAYTQT